MADQDETLEILRSVERRMDGGVFVLTEQSGDWTKIPSEAWFSHRENGAPLVGFSGNVHVARLVVEDDEIIMIHFHPERLDENGRREGEQPCGLSKEEIAEEERIWADRNATEADRRRRHELCEKGWRATLPPAEAMRRLLRHTNLPFATWNGSLSMTLAKMGLDPALWIETEEKRH